METLQNYLVSFAFQRPRYNASLEICDYYRMHAETVLLARSKREAIELARNWFVQDTGIQVDTLSSFMASEVPAWYAEYFESRD